MPDITENHCSYWEGIPQRNLNRNNRLHIQVLQEAMRRGVWNIPVNWDRVEFGRDNYTRFALCGGMATFDFDSLTRLVLASHERCVRVDVSPCNMQYMSVSMWTRDKRSSRTPHIHPTIESAVVEYRKSVG